MRAFCAEKQLCVKISSGIQKILRQTNILDFSNDFIEFFIFCNFHCPLFRTSENSVAQIHQQTFY